MLRSTQTKIANRRVIAYSTFNCNVIENLASAGQYFCTLWNMKYIQGKFTNIPRKVKLHIRVNHHFFFFW